MLSALPPLPAVTLECPAPHPPPGTPGPLSCDQVHVVTFGFFDIFAQGGRRVSGRGFRVVLAPFFACVSLAPPSLPPPSPRKLKCGAPPLLWAGAHFLAAIFKFWAVQRSECELGVSLWSPNPYC